MTGLTTHVLDTARGRPAAGVAVRLLREGVLLFEGVTNQDGRCPGLLATLEPGTYCLVFEIGCYFRETGATLPDPPFLDVVTIAFGVADASQHWHVPLLVSPYGYSTYRGS